MGRKAKVTKDEAVALVEKFIDHFRTSNLPSFNDSVWKAMSDVINNRWNHHVVYNNVHKDLRGILTLARKNCNIDTNNNVNINDSLDTTLEATLNTSGSFNELDFSYEFEDKAKGLDHFQLFIPKMVWEKMQSSEVRCNDGRTYNVLNKEQWTDILSILIFEQTRLPCAYVFDHAKIYPSSDSLHYLRIDGHCKSKTCRNVLFCYLEKDPGDANEIKMSLRTKETFWEKHEQVYRPLRGLRRQTAGKDIYYMGAGNWRKREGGFYAQFGGAVGPNVPSMNTARQAKNEYINKKLDVKPTDGQDVVLTIEKLRYNAPYSNFIREVRRDKFYVAYYANNQMLAYNQYCRMMKENAAPAIDGTGSLVKKIRRLDQTYSGHIFLYSVTVNYMGQTISVYDCLTESQDTDSLAWWLSQWLKSGATVPPQMNCDRSRALMNAICKTFNEQTLKVYNETLFLRALNDPEVKHRPLVRTYIRNDVAHLMIMVAKWEQFKKINFTTVRQFYLYCLGLMINARSINQFREIFLLTLAVGLQKSEEATIKAFSGKNVAFCRKQLENYIATHKFSFNLAQVEESCEKIHLEVEADKSEDSEEGSRLRNWINNLKREAERPQNCSENETGNLNVFYCKEFIERLAELAYEFPVWTGAVVSNSSGRASTAFMEGHFNDLKHRVNKNDPGLSRADKFLKRMLENNSNSAELFASNLRHLPKTAEKSTIPGDEDGLKKDLPRTQEHALCENFASNDNTSKLHVNDELDQSYAAASSFVGHENVSTDSSDFSNPLSEMGTAEILAKENHQSEIFGKSEAKSCYRIQKESTATIGQKHSSRQNGIPTLPKDEVIDSQYHFLSSTNSNPSSGEANIKDSVGLANTFHGRKRRIDSENEISDENMESELNKKHKKDNQAHLTRNVNAKELKSAQNQQNSSKKEGKYFRPRPDIIHRHTLSTNIKKSNLLWNGNQKATRVTIKESTPGPFYATNTCGFDSIVQIVGGALMDDPHYKKSVEGSEGMLQFVLNFIQTGATKKIYEDRVRLLYSLFPEKIKDHYPNLGSLRCHEIDMFTFLKAIWEACFKKDPSIVYCHTCNICGQYTSTKSTLAVDTNVIKANGFQDLENSLQFYMESRIVSCSYDNCSEQAIMQCVSFAQQIFIELDVRQDIHDRVGLSCRLDDFPKYMTLGIHQFRLAGVIGGNPGHFVAYCWRLNDKWDECNDIQKSINHVNASFKVIPQAVIYIRIGAEKEVSEILESSSVLTEHVALFENNEELNVPSETPEVVEMMVNEEVSRLTVPRVHTTDEKYYVYQKRRFSNLYCADNWRNKGTHDFYWIENSEENEESNVENIFNMNIFPQNKHNSRSSRCLLSMKVKDSRCHVMNMSSFDAIIHVLLCAILDADNYYEFAKLSCNELLEFCRNLLLTDFSESACQMRQTLFMKSFESVNPSSETNVLASHNIKTNDDIKTMWNTYFFNEPSIWKSFQCTNCNEYVMPATYLTVDHNCVIEKGYSALQEAVHFNSRLKKVPCRRSDCRNLCSVFCSTNFHVFIDLHIKARNRAKDGLKCKLETIPKFLDLGEISYRLHGIMAFTNDRYVAYCLRSANTWELYDSYSTSGIMQLPDTVEPHGAVYLISDQLVIENGVPELFSLI